ncbi:MAG: thiamine pyrophosphate-binding protein [Alphaproteobacteria bacterium]|nr:thiamine pyrophosphate-binding protein [Alphaproteobacteria bacterium]MDP6517949.1 thiamine pyrophosphate-binding protein [Alphaproteobacteria bacterium]
MNDAAGATQSVDWPGDIHRTLAALDVRQIAYVPDAGHQRLIELCQADNAMRMVPLTSEEEGVGLVAGAWLGGERGVLMMQSSGVGNCVNAIASITRACQFPLLMLITMRGEWGEGNPWQVPMGRATPEVLDTLGVQIARVDRAEDVAGAVAAMAALAFKSTTPCAVLLSQRLVGAKSFQD